MHKDDSSGSAPRLRPQTQTPDPARRQEGLAGPDSKPEHSPRSTTRNETDCLLITRIRVTHVTVKLRRIPVGFYVAIKTESGLKQTPIKPASVRKDVVEWDEEIVLPSDQSSGISLTTLASFELGPTLGNGEVLCEFETTIGELLDRHAQSRPIEFVEQCDEGANSFLSSFEVEIERRAYGRNKCATTSSLPESEGMRQLGELTDKGHRALVRYRELGEEQDLDESIKYFQLAQDQCLPNHPNRATVLFNLANAKLMYCRAHDASPNLDAPVDLYRDALRLRPHGHPDHPLTLLSLGITLRARFQRRGDEVDGEEGESLFAQVLGIASADSYVYHAAVLAQGSAAKPEQFRATVVSQAIESNGEIQRLDNALQRMFHPHFRRHVLLDHLGILFCVPFGRLDGIGDPEKTIWMLEVVVQAACDDHPDRLSWLNALGDSLSTRYECSGDDASLEKSITILDDVVRLTPDGHSDRASRLNSLGHSLSARYELSGDIADLERSISLFEDAVELILDGHPDKLTPLSNLGSSLSTRYAHSGNVADLERSISLREETLKCTPDGHRNMPVRLNNLGCSLLTRYGRFGEVVDLERSIFSLKDAVRFAPEGHPDRPLCLDSLGQSLSIRYKQFGDIVDLEESISLRKDALRCTPEGHPDQPARQNNLGCALSTHYKRLGDIADLEESISLLGKAVQSTPDGHPDKPSRLDNLGHSLLARHEQLGDTSDLERAISLREDALHSMHDDHPGKPSRLNNLGCSLSTRYERFGDVTDLERSISLFDKAVQLTPDGHPDKPSRLDNLGHSLSTRYQRFGDAADLESSIKLREDTLHFTPDGHPDKPLRLNNLATSLSTRYDRFGDVADLERSISLCEDAVQTAPDGYTDKFSWLNNLSYLLSTRYTRFGNIDDLERTISLREHVIQILPDGHPHKPIWLNNLGRSLSIRHEHFGDIADLEKSIAFFKDAVQSTPSGHPDKINWSNNLGSSLWTRYRCSGNTNTADLEESISLFENVVQSTPDGHPDKPAWSNNLAIALYERFLSSGDPSSPHLSRAISHSSHAARSLTGPSVQRLEASQTWIGCARLLERESQDHLLDAYTVVIDLLPQLAWMGLSLEDRYHQLLQAADEACDAAATALEVHRPKLAVEWLEQGRSVVWNQLSQLRTPVDDLRSRHPELAAQFEHISHELEFAGAEEVVNESTDQSNLADGSLEKQARRHHSLAVSREKLLIEIRALPDFERFLLPKTIDQLSSLAHSGPVVFLNASNYRCDALIVMAGSEHVVHLPLSDINYDEVAGMQLQLNELLRLKGRVISRDSSTRGARVQGMTPDDVFRSILLYLWKKVVSPILEVLPLPTSDNKLPRIFWCPTGPFSFLPIHAAGLYGTANPGPRLSDFAISSYIPTMSALELPRAQEKSEATLRNVRLLAVPRPSTDGQTHLPNVPGEIEAIKKLASSSLFVGFQEADGTVEDVLSKMTETDWIHFACHGTQDRAHPYDSGFILAHGKRLKLPDIARVSRPHGGLAFLSACYTATGDEQLSEEAIHIASGMLLAGYRGVIATMWSILDDDAPRVTEDVYGRLFGEGRVPDVGQAAEALHDAIERLRDSGAPFLSWVPFIHVGS